ncbi:uncharacterized protein [Spinacia oleracea]|uniref:Uncharacterized protein isoform X2 n=1 Tax=Spinacia oleracea TaxID=3562 RepID=A0A9R0IQY0_SPIOL|nr:uncharacterized protein LOC110793044 isoform X2 [Spinacia oleracea]
MAGPALNDLFQSLISKTGHDKITNEESNVFVDWKSRASNSCAFRGTVASGLAWIATRKWRTANRVLPVTGAFLLTVGWTFSKSVDSCVDRILGMDGSRMQYELEKIILEKYGNDPEKMKPFSKHFYCEEIFNDSAPGRPKSVYRQRHLYVDDQRTTNENLKHESAKKGVNHQHKKDDSNVKLKSPNAETKQVPICPC